MKQEFINLIIADLIKYKDFMPLRDQQGNITIGHGVNIVSKSLNGIFTVVELLDGDSLSKEDIRNRLDHNRNWLLEIRGSRLCYFLEVFVFSSSSDSDKAEVISNGQLQEFLEKKHLQCISINLFEKSLYRYSESPVLKSGVEKIIKKRLENDVYNEEKIIDIEELVKQKENELKIEFKSKVPVLTYALITINILVWIFINVYAWKSGQDVDLLLISFGAKENSLILSGEYWRFITPIFLHANIAHLLVNCYSLYAVGVAVEKIYGHGRFFIIYLAAGVIGNIASFMFSQNPGVGASGAIFGMLGALIYLGLEKPKFFRKYFGYNIIASIVINLVYGLSTPGIDNYAHMGGLAGGFFTAGVVSVKGKSKWYLNKFLYLVLALTISASGLIYGFNSKQNKLLLMVNEMAGFMSEKNWTEAERIGEEIITEENIHESTKLSVLFNIVISEEGQGKYDEAIGHAVEVKKIDQMRGQYMLGILYFNRQQYDKAKEELLGVKKIDADFGNTNEVLNRIEQIERKLK